jgi:hypothetical protein
MYNLPASPPAFLVCAVILSCAGFLPAAQASSNKVGDRVEAEWKKGLWYTARIMEVNGEQYKVRYESDGVVQTVTPDRLRQMAQRGLTTSPAPSLASGKVPVIAHGFPVMAGTAWKIDWGIRGSNVQVFLFCKSGRWEVVSPMRSSGAVSLMGNYEVQGSRLVTRNLNGREVTTYRMSWKDGVLELDSGKSQMRLHYNTTTDCK